MVGFYVGRDQNVFFISRELWRLEISAVEEQRPCWELPWRPVWKSTTVSGAFLGDDVAALAPSGDGKNRSLPLAAFHCLARAQRG